MKKHLVLALVALFGAAVLAPAAPLTPPSCEEPGITVSKLEPSDWICDSTAF